MAADLTAGVEPHRSVLHEMGPQSGAGALDPRLDGWHAQLMGGGIGRLGLTFDIAAQDDIPVIRFQGGERLAESPCQGIHRPAGGLRLDERVIRRNGRLLEPMVIDYRVAGHLVEPGARRLESTEVATLAQRFDEDVLKDVVGQGGVVHVADQPPVQLGLVRLPGVEHAAERRHLRLRHRLDQCTRSPLGTNRGPPDTIVVMGPLTFSTNVTLDGCVDHREGVVDDETHELFTRLMDESSAMLWGRVTYEMMESYWPGVARGEVEVPPATREWAVKLETKPKYVVSSTRQDYSWTNSHHIGGDLRRGVQALKDATPSGVLLGSVTLANELERLDLIDEYRFLVHPRLAGHGPTLYQGGLPTTRQLELISARPLRCGAIAVHYRRAR